MLRDVIGPMGSGVMLVAGALLACGCGSGREQMDSSLELAAGWSMQAAATVAESGEAVSLPGYGADSWLAASVPTTPMAAKVAAGEYPDLYLGDNLEKVDTSVFDGPWWYRADFEISGEQATRSARLALDGINYSADLWLNGRLVAGRETLVGAFRTFDLDVGEFLKPGPNAIAIQVHPPQPGDFTIGFVDWNPRPPDRNMGVWRPVTLHFTGEVSLSQVFVASDVDLQTLESADLEVSVLVKNHSDRQLSTSVTGTIEDIRFSTDVTLAPGEEKTVPFTSEHHDGLKLSSPRLWWPHTLGSPELYEVALEAVVDGTISDTAGATFGVREFSTYFNDEGHRGFKVNGSEVLIRGGGWVDDLLLSDTEETIAAQIQYVKHMGLNTIRLEGFWGTDHTIYDIADREGVLVMPGWSCQWEWEDYLGKPVDETYGGVLEPDEIALVAASLKDQVVLFRNHPSVFTWVLASDLLPHPDLERQYRAALTEVDGTRPPLVSCGWVESEVSGPSGVKMSGPYDWVPPVYWYEDRDNGGAYGFNTETGPGPQPPPLESLKRMIPEDNLWPPDEIWDYHCGRNEFNTPNRYIEAVDKRYGASSSVEEFLRKAQVANYEAIRPMFEAFAVNRPLSTGIIQWMLNSAWPEMFWQLYDHYLMPNGAFYGARVACRPLGLAYNYHDRAVYAVNDTLDKVSDLTALIRVFDLDGEEIINQTLPVEVAGGSSAKVLSLADMKAATPVYFVDLRLTAAGDVEMARNFYWLSSTDDVLDYENNKWFYTPTRDFADFTALANIDRVSLDAEAGVRADGDRSVVTVRLTNPSDTLAFFVELRVVDESDRSFLPVLWDDNYISILPGEDRELQAVLPKTVAPSEATLKLSGWNVAEVSVALEAVVK